MICVQQQSSSSSSSSSVRQSNIGAADVPAALLPGLSVEHHHVYYDIQRTCSSVFSSLMSRLATPLRWQ
jgi:hypothetical protein